MINAPEEDSVTAISFAPPVDKSLRVKASESNCYKRMVAAGIETYRAGVSAHDT